MREWPRIVALLAVLFAAAVLRPAVLVAPALLLLFVARRELTWPTSLLSAVALAVLLTGSSPVGGETDGVWNLERAWAFALGSLFLLLCTLFPKWWPTSRAIVATIAASGVAAAIFLFQPGAWTTVDWLVLDGLKGAVVVSLDLLTVLRDGQALPAAFTTAMYEVAESRAAVFPALLIVSSTMALLLTHWVVHRAAGDPRGGLAPLSEFRFNDHLVWLLIAGLALTVARPGESPGRVGANVLVAMGALYAARGTAVVLGVTGGLSVAGYVLTGSLLLLLPPAVLGTAIMIGVGDTWLDLRAVARDQAT